MSSCDRELCVGARNSALSRAQVDEVYRELIAFHPDVRFTLCLTESFGDKNKMISLRDLGKSDFFTKEIDEMLLSGACRIAIHSAKDLPEPLTHGLMCIALTRGVDPSDSLVLRKGEQLKRGAKIGTSSIRREENLKMLESTLQCVDIRGTIDERLQLLESGAIDGLVVATAALIRLNLLHLNRIVLEGQSAPLQGKLAILARNGDDEMAELFSCL
jgi:hydroxymethylbilane synthase